MINLAMVLLIVLEVIGSCSVSSCREDAGVEEAIAQSEIFSMFDEVLYQVTLIHSFSWNNSCTFDAFIFIYCLSIAIRANCMGCYFELVYFRRYLKGI